MKAWAERRQVPLYLASLAAGGWAGWAAPALGRALDHAILPLLGLLLYATFLTVPVTRVARSVRDGRFLGAVLTVNFVVVPAVVLGVVRLAGIDDDVLVGVLLVLLTPCVDYVVVFAGLAGGARSRLIAATPLLMAAQVLLLPVLLWLIGGPRATAAIDVGPFATSFLVLVVLPLAAAALTQWAAVGGRRAAGERPVGRRGRMAAGLSARVEGAMVPLMMAVLATVVASQVAALGDDLHTAVGVAPLYAGFVAVMLPAGLGVARLARLDVPGARAVVFSGVTRNSLVVLPLALAVSPVAALVVVTQTVVELAAMVLCVRLVPRLLPPRDAPRDGGAQRPSEP